MAFLCGSWLFFAANPQSAQGSLFWCYMLLLRRDAAQAHWAHLHQQRMMRLLVGWLLVAVRQRALSQAVGRVQRNAALRTEGCVMRAWGAAVEEAWCADGEPKHTCTCINSVY